MDDGYYVLEVGEGGLGGFGDCVGVVGGDIWVVCGGIVGVVGLVDDY